MQRNIYLCVQMNPKKANKIQKNMCTPNKCRKVYGTYKGINRNAKTKELKQQINRSIKKKENRILYIIEIVNLIKIKN